MFNEHTEDQLKSIPPICVNFKRLLSIHNSCLSYIMPHYPFATSTLYSSPHAHLMTCEIPFNFSTWLCNVCIYSISPLFSDITASRSSSSLITSMVFSCVLRSYIPLCNSLIVCFISLFSDISLVF
uniref:Uncharacterized protein n=1 Tax=Opuntia streptacantha TaxID=393608 RepID=A0A7C8ZWV5_OPUST